jgi:uncharacterized protein (TIGR03435 family)
MAAMRRFVLASFVLFAGAAALPAQVLQFEVASIRRNHSGDPSSSFRVEPGGRLTVTNRTLFDVVRSAYEVQRAQIVTDRGLPDWFETDRWDIQAKAPDGVTTQPQMLAMARQLLADRFGLSARRETREVPAYALTLAHADGRLGRQLRRADGQCEAATTAAAAGTAATTPPTVARGFCGTRSGPSHLFTSGLPMAQIARHLSVYAGRPVVDRTGLPGTFDLDLEWTAEQPGPLENVPAGDRGSLFTAIQEQLGLKLEPSRVPVDVLVVERAERPAEN